MIVIPILAAVVLAVVFLALLILAFLCPAPADSDVEMEPPGPELAPDVGPWGNRC